MLWPVLAWLAAGAIASDPQAAQGQDGLSYTADLSLRPSGPTMDRTLTPDVSLGALDGSSVRLAQYAEPAPSFGGPMGAERAHFAPGPAVDPGLDPEIFVDEPIGEYYDPFDPEAPAPTVSSGEWIRNGLWYTEQSAVYMIRNVNVRNEIRLATDISSAILPEFFSRLDIAPDMGYQPGLRSTLGRYVGRDPKNRDHAVEFTFLGLLHWGDGESLTAQRPGAIISNIDPTNNLPAFNGSDFQSYFQTSSFNSYELNYRINRRLSRDQMLYTRDSTWVRRVTRAPLPSIFFGLRVVSIAETLNYLANSSTANGSYNIATHNTLAGLQTGGDWFYEHYEWRLGGRAKVGSLVNWSNQSSRVRILDDNGTPLVPNRDEFADSHNLAFVGELTFIAAYQFTPNFAFRSSYDVMWVTNLALAQNQITFSPSDPTQISGLHSLFFQTFSIGLEWTR